MSCVVELNDELRKTFGGGHIMVMPGVRKLHPDLRLEVMQAVQNFNAFTPENDPEGEHTCGSFILEQQVFIWRIDCYDLSLSAPSPDPADTTVTIRVLTVCTPEEY